VSQLERKKDIVTDSLLRERVSGMHGQAGRLQLVAVMSAVATGAVLLCGLDQNGGSTGDVLLYHTLVLSGIHVEIKRGAKEALCLPIPP